MWNVFNCHWKNFFVYSLSLSLCPFENENMIGKSEFNISTCQFHNCTNAKDRIKTADAKWIR